MSAQASVIDSHVESKAELEYGLVYYAFYQKRYFRALVEDAYAVARQNKIAMSDEGELLKGGMLLSYGMADDAKVIFETLLEKNAPPLVRNRAWYFMARFYYNKSDITNAAKSLSFIKGEIPQDLVFDYYYLSTLVKTAAKSALQDEGLDKSLVDAPQYPYLLFNLAIGQLRQGKLVQAVANLELVKSYEGVNEEYLVLSDRAKLALAQIAMQKGRFDQAWRYLTEIRTTGLYSNRALLNYAWAAIKIKRFPDATAALKLLNTRSIASPEVQEAKVLLAHLYEQEGSPRKALKANLLSIQDFKTGVAMVNEARRIIDKQDVPEEFITNMDAIIDDSDWHSATPSVDYKNLTPFLIDLMSGHPFNETLKELADLYYLRENLQYWLQQAREHLIIMENATKKAFDEKSHELVRESAQFKGRFKDKKSELNLLNLTLDKEDQSRIDVLLKSTSEALAVFDEKVEMFSSLENVYTLPSSYRPEINALHRRIKMLLQKTELSIVKLEPVMRSLVKAELDKHEERMNYYSAQSRLAKARLYDTTLSTLRDAQQVIKEEQGASQ
ncbi:MAG: hypothetical protein K6L80_02645 [Agarilytica sp.]